MNCILRALVFIVTFNIATCQVAAANIYCGENFDQAVKSAEFVFKGRVTSSGNTTAGMIADYARLSSASPAGMMRLPERYVDVEVLFSYKGVLPSTMRIFVRGPQPPDTGTIRPLQVKKILGVYMEDTNACSSIFQQKLLDAIEATQVGLDDVIKAYPASPTVYLKKIEAYEQYDDSGQAMATLEAMAHTLPQAQNSPEFLLVKGRLLYETQKYEESLALLRDITAAPAEKYRQLDLLKLGRMNELNGRKLQLSGQELKDLSFSGLDLSGSDFSGATLANVKFNNVILSHANFADSRLQIEVSASDLSGAAFARSKFSGSTDSSHFDDVNFSGGEIRLQSSATTFRNADFSKSALILFAPAGAVANNFKDAKFTGTTIVGMGKALTAGADFSGASAFLRPLAANTNSAYEAIDVSGQNLSGATFENGDFSGVSFRGAKLEKAKFTGSTLAGADFTGANLSGADFTGSGRAVDLSGANFTRAIIEGARFDGAAYDCKTQFDAAIDPQGRGMEPLDTACARKPEGGIISYSAERYKRGHVKVCYGDFHANCIYGFLIGAAFAVENKNNRLVALIRIASSLLDGKEDDLARAVLYRAYMEYRQYGGNKMPGRLYQLLSRVNVPLTVSLDKLAFTDDLSPLQQTKKRTDIQASVERALIVHDGIGAQAAASQALAGIANQSLEQQIVALLQYADLFLLIDGPFAEMTRSQLLQQLRTAPLAVSDKGSAPDYVAKGEALLKESEAELRPSWSASLAPSAPAISQKSKSLSSACPAGWGLDPSYAKNLAKHAQGGILVKDPLVDAEAQQYGNILNRPLDLLLGQDTYSDTAAGFIDVDGVTLKSAEIINFENRLPNSTYILATGLSGAEEQHIVVKGDPAIDSVNLDGCLKWELPEPVADNPALLRYVGHDSAGYIAAVDVAKDIKVGMIDPIRIAEWMKAAENYSGQPYKPADAGNIAVYENWLTTSIVPSAREAVGVIVQAMKAGGLPTEFLQPTRMSIGGMLLAPLPLEGRGNAVTPLKQVPSCANLPIPNYISEFSLLTAEQGVRLTDCNSGNRAFLLTNAHDVLGVDGDGLNIIFTGAGDDEIVTGGETDIVVLKKGWGHQKISKSCLYSGMAGQRIMRRVSQSRAFGGIGISFSNSTGNFVVEKVSPGLGAARANIKAGDIITKVNGSPLLPMTREELLAALRGRPGTSVNVTYTPADGTGEKSVFIERSPIETEALAVNSIAQQPSAVDYKWPYQFTNFIVFGTGIEPQDIVMNGSSLKNIKTGDDISFSDGACFNLAYSGEREYQPPPKPPEQKKSSDISAAGRSAPASAPRALSTRREENDLILMFGQTTNGTVIKNFFRGPGVQSINIVLPAEGDCEFSINDDGKIIDAKCKK